jgi:Trk K+ transport system NAD-binding subunit
VRTPGRSGAGTGNSFGVPGGATTIAAGDVLLLLANADSARAIERLIAGEPTATG